MNRSTSRITDDMFARIPALLLEGTTKAEIAAMYGVTLGTLVVLCSQRGISLRKGGPRPKRTSLTLPDEPLPLSDGVLKSLREATLAMGNHGTAGQRSLGEDRQRRSLQGSAGRGGCVMIWRLLASVLAGVFAPVSGHRQAFSACQQPT
jgi:hypothetical protein